MKETKMELKAKKLLMYYAISRGTFSLIVLLTFIAHITIIQSLGFFLVWVNWIIFSLWMLSKLGKRKNAG